VSLEIVFSLFNAVWFFGAELYEQAIKYEKGSFITATGALATLSGAKTGRSPRDKRVVKDDLTENELWWGKWVLSFNSYQLLCGVIFAAYESLSRYYFCYVFLSFWRTELPNFVFYRGSPNIEMDEHTFMVNRERAVDYLNSLDKVISPFFNYHTYMTEWDGMIICKGSD